MRSLHFFSASKSMVSTPEVPKKRISQATFDETVHENMVDLEMDRADAVKDALQQFTSQGVDLENICVTLNENDGRWLEEVDAQLTALKSCLDSGTDLSLPPSWSPKATLAALQALHSALTDSDIKRADNARKLLGSKDAVNVIARIWQEWGDETSCVTLDPADAEVVAKARLLAVAVTEAACGGGSAGDQSKHAFRPTSMRMLCQAARRAQMKEQRSFLIASLSLVRVLSTRAEDHKVSFVEHGGLDTLVECLEKESWASDCEIVRETCGAIKAVTAVDDFRKDFSASHTHTRALTAKGCIPVLLQACRRFGADSDTVATGLDALRNLANNEESVNQIASEGGVSGTVRALQAHLSHPALARAATGLFRNVSADDRHKTRLCKNGAAQLMLEAMREHAQERKIQEHGLATLGAMALRSPDNCRHLSGMGAVSVILEALERHPEARAIQRQGCLAVRNMVSRVPELGEAFLEAGAEPLLRLAGRYQESVDEAYAALRDLKCDVKRVIVDPLTGKIKAPEEFGSAKTSFRPVFDSSNDIEGAVQAAINAPSNSYRF